MGIPIPFTNYAIHDHGSGKVFRNANTAELYLAPFPQ